VVTYNNEDYDRARRARQARAAAEATLASPPPRCVPLPDETPSSHHRHSVDRNEVDLSPLFNWGHIVEEIDQRVAVKVAAERAQLDERIASERVYMADVIDEALDQYDKDVDDKIAKAVTEALAKANEAHRNELDAERVRHKDELLQFRTVLNELTVALSRLTANEQTRAAAVLDLPALPRRDRSGMN
jgi:hypothetical protein